MELRCSVPPPVAVVDPRMGEDGMEWHENGDELPEWAIGAALVALGVILLMVASLLLAAHGRNWPDTPGPVATPTTYGPPRG